jgi:hypothetical protein
LRNSQLGSFRCHWRTCSPPGSTFQRDMANSFQVILLQLRSNCQRDRDLTQKRCCFLRDKTCRQGMASTRTSQRRNTFQQDNALTKLHCKNFPQGTEYMQQMCRILHRKTIQEGRSLTQQVRLKDSTFQLGKASTMKTRHRMPNKIQQGTLPCHCRWRSPPCSTAQQGTGCS